MIQRIQTIYLFLAVVVLCLCLMMPVGVFHPEAMGVDATMFNLAIVSTNPALQVPCLHQSTPLFLVLVIVCIIALAAIFLFKHRKLQARLCSVSIFLCAVWYVLYFVYGYLVGIEGTVFGLKLGMGLPFLAVVLLYLARRGVLADERLVRAADRIR